MKTSAKKSAQKILPYHRIRILSPHLAALLLPALLLLAAYLLRGLLGRGEDLLLYSELNDRYFALLRAMKNPTSVSEALASVSSSDMLTVAALAASPLNWLVALAPLSSAASAFALVSVMRAALSALTFSLYLSERRLPAYAHLALSTMYALCSYAVVTTYSPLYIDTLILIPLIILGIERLILGRRIALYATALALALLTNPEAAVPLLLFSVLYAVYFSALRKGTPISHLLNGLALVSGALIAVAAAATVLLPHLSMLAPQPTAYRFINVLDILDLLAKALPGSYDGAADAHLPYLYAGIAPLLLLPVYFASPRIPRRERICSGILVFLLCFSFSIESLNAAWSFFDASLPRYTGAIFLVFLMLSMAARAFSVLDGRAERILLISSGVLTLLVSIIQRLRLTYRVSDGESESRFEFVSDVPALWISLFFTVLLVASLTLLCRHGKGGLSFKGERLAALALLFTICLEMLLSCSETMKLIDKDEGYQARGEFKIYESAAAAGKELLADSPLYRIELTDRRTETDALLHRYPSLLDFRTDTLAAFGIKTNESGAVTGIASPLMLSLLGVRYFIERETVDGYMDDGTLLKYPATSIPYEIRDRYVLITEIGDNGGTQPLVYENAATLPMLFLASTDVKDTVYSSNTPTPETLNSIFSALTNGKSAPYVALPYIEYLSERDPNVQVPGYSVYGQTQTRGYQIEYRITAEINGPLYFSMFSIYPRAATVSARNVTKTLFEKEEDSTLATVCLGNYSAGESVTVKLNFGESSDQHFYIPNDSTLFWQEDRPAAEEAISSLSARGATSLKIDGSALIATVEAAEGEILFTTLPADGCWTVLVDGKKTEPIASLGCLLTVPLGSAGKHTVSLSRTLPEAPLPTALTVLGVTLLTALAICESFARGRCKALFYYAEATASKEDEAT